MIYEGEFILTSGFFYVYLSGDCRERDEAKRNRAWLVAEKVPSVSLFVTRYFSIYEHRAKPATEAKRSVVEVVHGGVK